MLYDYDGITAFHYSAYRPQLHHQILTRCLGQEVSFVSGLDIGSGTGQSSLALTNFCNEVVGIEPSQEMLSKALIHPKVTYRSYDKHTIASEDNIFNIVTLAGSLWYAKSQQLLDEICRVGKNKGLVIPYDFDMLLTDILTLLGYKANDNNSSAYNHQENFSGLNTNQIEWIEAINEQIEFNISIQNLGHLILSEKENYLFFAENYGKEDLFSKVVKELSKLTQTENMSVSANLFATKYCISK